ncbi:MAG: hypothetical protein LBD17_00925 [Endomicrobium sp.]|jgi:hypothetical protein|nr:hypothetical protein [Endomicrobium sp.]
MKEYLMFMFCLLFAVSLGSCSKGSDSSNLTKRPGQITNVDGAEELSPKDEAFIPGKAEGTESPTVESVESDIVAFFDFGEKGIIRLNKFEDNTFFLCVQSLNETTDHVLDEKILKVEITGKAQKVGLIGGADLIFTANTTENRIRMIAKDPDPDQDRYHVESFNPKEVRVKFCRGYKSSCGLKGVEINIKTGEETRI